MKWKRKTPPFRDNIRLVNDAARPTTYCCCGRYHFCLPALVLLLFSFFFLRPAATRVWINHFARDINGCRRVAVLRSKIECRGLRLCRRRRSACTYALTMRQTDKVSVNVFLIYVTLFSFLLAEILTRGISLPYPCYTYIIPASCGIHGQYIVLRFLLDIVWKYVLL